jgi:protein-ribulosamine 3-kinase
MLQREDFTMPQPGVIFISEQALKSLTNDMQSAIPKEIIGKLERELGCRVRSFSPSGGGCINHGGRLVTSGGIFFLKWNDRSQFPSMLETEARGLKLLATSKTLRIPEVIIASETPAFQFLVLEFLEPREKSAGYWEQFGTGLARLHQQSCNQFGLEYDNYIGSIPQANQPSKSWIDFFIDYRLKTQMKLAIKNKMIDVDIANKFETLYRKLLDLLAIEKPSLLHGDLWSGNVITDDNGSPALIDPAVYYGNREMDLAMTLLFGGFDSTFMDSYSQVSPLVPGFEKRRDIYNLYPLMVHVNLFGKTYAGQVVSILNDLV